MPTSSNSPFDQSVLDLIEHNAGGSVPHTPTYDDALARLRSTQQIYANADHKGGHVTARSLAGRAPFYATNLPGTATSLEQVPTLETNASIFARYLASLSPAQRVQAEKFRLAVTGRPVHHRHKGEGPQIHDPLSTIFLLPGGGPQPGLPGNYLHGFLSEGQGDAWCIQVLDSDTDLAVAEEHSLAKILERFQDLLACAPFHLTELESLGFTLR